MKRSQYLAFAMASLVLAAAIGCKSTRTVVTNTQFRVMNASVEQPNLTVLLNSTTLETSLAYPTATSYSTQAPGGYIVHVEPTGTTTALINQPVVLQPGSSYTFIAAEAAFASPSLAPIFLNDDNTAPSSSQIKLRIVNASPDAGNLDVYAIAPGASIQGASPNASNLPFKSASSYLSLPAGNYEIFFTPTGQKTVLIDSSQLTFSAGQIRTVVALDTTGGFGAAVLADLN